jgi:hypothetical protein
VAESVREEFGARVQRDLLPWLMLTRTAERFYAKPRGYAGDYLSIAWMYDNQAQGTGRLGRVIDRCFLDEPPCCAVRNRRRLMADQIQRHLSGNAGRPIRVTTMACGPAREVFDVFATLDDPSRLEVTLIDVDQEALAYVRQEIAARGLEGRIRVFHGNLVYLAMGRQKVDLHDQDLIYSMGLIDYLNDKLVGKLMDWVHGCLAPGGEMILGNFHTSSRTKALADYVLDWRMIHRTVDDMNRLCAGSAFQRPCTEILFEAAQVDLFAKCRKE